MTTPDPLRAYLEALPRRCRTHLNVTDAVVAAVHTAVRDQHWTPELLAAESSRDLETAHNIGATITARLRKATQHEPVGRGVALPTVARLPFCSPDCATRAGWIEDQHGNPTGRCPCRTQGVAR